MDNEGTIPATQPVGYWSGVVHRSVVRYVSDAMAEEGITQPHWWALNQLSGGAVPREELPARLAPRLRSIGADAGAAEAAVDDLLDRGWAVADPKRRLRLTGDGHAALSRARALAAGLRARIHEGIDDTEYVAALRVLRRMVRNVGGPDALL